MIEIMLGWNWSYHCLISRLIVSILLFRAYFAGTTIHISVVFYILYLIFLFPLIELCIFNPRCNPSQPWTCILPHPVQEFACQSVITLVSLTSFYTYYSVLFSRVHSIENFFLFLNPGLVLTMYPRIDDLELISQVLRFQVRACHT